MNNHSLPAPLAAVIVFLVMVFLPASASAAPAVESTEKACYVTPKAGVRAVNVRLRPNNNSTRLGIIQAGQRAPASCDATEGASYTACGGTNSWWNQVTWSGRTGYVAHLCVDWISE